MSDDYTIGRFLNEIDQMRLHKSSKAGLALKKPLLLLLVLSEIEAGRLRANRIAYSQVETRLGELIESFGGRSARRGGGAEQPFDHLGSSPFWQLVVPGLVREGRKETLTRGVLRDPGVYAHFPETLFNLLQSAENRAQVADFILSRWWPETCWQELRIELGLSSTSQIVLPRDPNFVTTVLRNYRYRCAACGFDALFDARPFGVDAAHIRWRTHDGPDTLSNGLALCQLHHWALDRGVISIDPNEMKWMVSGAFVARDSVSQLLLSELKDRSLSATGERLPDLEFLEWHRNAVYVA